MRISDWSSDVCSSDLAPTNARQLCWRAGRAGEGGFGISPNRGHPLPASPGLRRRRGQSSRLKLLLQQRQLLAQGREREAAVADAVLQRRIEFGRRPATLGIEEHRVVAEPARSEEHTSELQSLMRISYAVFCLKKKKKQNHNSTAQPK